jgi:radical SAM protein with 4Fe4S-binding SPASM domain
LEALAYTDWSLGVHNLSVAKRVPISAAIEVTRRCNNSCVHCYNNLALKDQSARQNELSAAEYFPILEEIAAAGCLWVLFTLITPDIADYLVEWPPFYIEITLYGRTRQIYEQVTGIPGSYDRCLQGIRLLTERNLPLKLKSMALTVNQHEIWEMKRFVEEELGLEFRFDALVNPRFDCSQSPIDVRLTPAEVVKLDLLDPERVAEWKKFAVKFGGPPNSPEQARQLWRCGGGLNAFAIDAYGMLRMCALSQNDAYDLRQGSFEQGWGQALYHLRQKRISKETKCVTCGIRSMCGMCTANAELECMDAEAPVDFLCQVAHLRAYCFGIPVPPHGDCQYCEGGNKYKMLKQTTDKLIKESRNERFA